MAYTSKSIAAAQRAQHFSIKGDSAPSYDEHLGQSGKPKTLSTHAVIDQAAGRATPALDPSHAYAHLGGIPAAERIAAAKPFHPQLLSADEIRNRQRESHIGLSPEKVYSHPAQQQLSVQQLAPVAVPQYGEPALRPSPFGKQHAATGLSSHWQLPDMQSGQEETAAALHSLHPSSRKLWDSSAAAAGMKAGAGAGAGAGMDTPTNNAQAQRQQVISPRQALPRAEYMPPAAAFARKQALYTSHIGLSPSPDPVPTPTGSDAVDPIAHAVAALEHGNPAALPPGKYPVTQMALKELQDRPALPSAPSQGASEYVPSSVSRSARQSLYTSPGVGQAVLGLGEQQGLQEQAWASPGRLHNPSSAPPGMPAGGHWSHPAEPASAVRARSIKQHQLAGNIPPGHLR